MNEAGNKIELDNIIVNSIKYKINLSDYVVEDIENGLITIENVELALLDIPNTILEEQKENEDFMVDSVDANMRLVISKADKNLNILIARKRMDFLIY